MYKRIGLGAAALAGLAMAIFTGCSATGVDSIQISPTSQSLAVGQTVQFTATGVVGHGQHPSSTEDLTDSVTWASSAPAIATVNSSGLATAVAPGSTTITATMNGFPGVISATATVTVTGSGSSGSSSSVVSSLVIVPGTQSLAAPGQTAQFLAIGTTSSGTTVDMTSQVAWSTSSAQIATIGANTGLATAVGQGTATITAIYSNASSGTVVTGTATLTVTGASAEEYTALTVTPGSQSISASGQTGQFIAIATVGTGLQEDVTSSKQIKWSSSAPSIATVSSTGLATGVSVGNSTITAELTNPDGSIVSATATVTVTSAPAPEPLLSLTIIPASVSVGGLQDTGQFLAIGTFSTPPTVRDLTNSVTWLSSAPNIFPVNSNGTGVPNPGAPAGVVTAEGSGSAVIIAEATDPATGSIQTATAQFNCPLVLPNPPQTPGSCYPGSQSPALLATLTVYNEGNNTGNWLITAPSATGTPDVLHCGPGSSAAGLGGSVCVATYPIGTTVTVTAPTESGVNFGGWTSNCAAIGTVTATGPNSCTVTLTTNDTVGAIFN